MMNDPAGLFEEWRILSPTLLTHLKITLSRRKIERWEFPNVRALALSWVPAVRLPLSVAAAGSSRPVYPLFFLCVLSLPL
jgi:hypothetical protein